MTAPPETAHQGAVLGLAVLLRQAARPLGLRTLVAPLAWRIGPGQVAEPDLMVVSTDALTARAMEASPLLVTEVLSPTGRNRDLFEKRRLYALGSAPTYWLFDPAEPNLTVLRLVGDEYEEGAHVTGSSVYVTSSPFPIRVVPSEVVS